MPKQPKKEVREHLNRRGIDPKLVPDGVMDALNACSENELRAMDSVGASLEADTKLDATMKISMVH